MLRLMIFTATAALAVLFTLLFPPVTAHAAKCSNTGAGFSKWLGDIRKEARASGISQRTINRALRGIRYDRKVIRRDRSQRSFKLSFQQFYKRRVGAYILKRARTRMRRNKALFDRIERRYGVPREILVTIWGLETDFGRGGGKYEIVQSVATLTYDCRRSSFFRPHLFAALRIIDRGDMQPSQMRGGWAGEIGQVQFLPNSYDKYAVDFDGDGRRDLIRSVPDLLASTASYLKGHGWKRGAGWQPGQPNYPAIKAWNRAGVYAKTIARMALTLQKRRR